MRCDIGSGSLGLVVAICEGDDEICVLVLAPKLTRAVGEHAAVEVRARARLAERLAQLRLVPGDVDAFLGGK